jgi:O-antigen/teichoic acid export membrane protein
MVANFAGRAWAAALGLVFPPIYARLLGIESYGLVGVWASLNGILSVLDLGLSTTLNREMARHSTDHDAVSQRAMRDITRTIEAIFWGAGLVAGSLIFLLAPFVARHWVNAQHLSADLVTSSVRLMGIVFALQWPVGVYNGALLGLQKQGTANAIQALFLFIRLVGGAVLLWKVSASIHVFFLWQAAAMAAQTGVTGIALSRCLPGRRGEGSFRLSVLATNWRFSTGMFLISILAIILLQADKLIVSKLLSLEQFGYYTLAWIVGSALANLINPIFVAVFPRLTQLVKQKDLAELTRVYHMSCQLLSVLVLPAAAVLAIFSREALVAWSGDPRLVTEASRAVTIVAIGSALNGLMNMPYALQLAFGWTRLTVVTNTISIVVVVPLEYWLAKRYGMAGAAAGWVVLNGGYVVFQLQAVHMRLLRGEQWRWYFVDVGLPLLAVATVLVPARVLLSAPHSRIAIAGQLFAVGGAAVLAAAMSAPELRRRGLTFLPARWRGRSQGNAETTLKAPPAG